MTCWLQIKLKVRAITNNERLIDMVISRNYLSTVIYEQTLVMQSHSWCATINYSTSKQSNHHQSAVEVKKRKQHCVTKNENKNGWWWRGWSCLSGSMYYKWKVGLNFSSLSIKPDLVKSKMFKGTLMVPVDNLVKKIIQIDFKSNIFYREQRGVGALPQVRSVYMYGLKNTHGLKGKHALV